MKILMTIYEENKILGSIILVNSGLGFELMFKSNNSNSYSGDIPLFDKYVMGGIPDCPMDSSEQDEK